MARSTVSLEHGTIRGAAGDGQIVKGTDARPRSQDFVLWIVEHDEGDRGPREADHTVGAELKAIQQRDRLQRENGDSRILLTWIHLSCSLKQGTAICYENCPRHSLPKDINFNRNMEVHPPLFRRNILSMEARETGQDRKNMSAPASQGRKDLGRTAEGEVLNSSGTIDSFETLHIVHMYMKF